MIDLPMIAFPKETENKALRPLFGFTRPHPTSNVGTGLLMEDGGKSPECQFMD